MTLYRGKYRVESTRLRGFDYSGDGYYFVTICLKYREYLFGQIINGKMYMNEYGLMVQQCWDDLPNHYPNLRLDEFVVMPNHVHGIMIIDNVGVVETGFKPVSTGGDGIVETGLKPVSTMRNHGLFEFVRALKTFSSRKINEVRGTVGHPIWQTRFWDRIIRDEQALHQIRIYIRNNPQAWKHDPLVI